MRSPSPRCSIFVGIYTPNDIVEVTNAYYDWVPRIDAVMIGDSGGSDWLQLDTRAGAKSPVVLLSPGGQGWEDTIIQANSIDEFINVIESRQFQFVFAGGAHYRPRR